MKTSVNSMVSNLSNSNSTLDLFNGTNIATNGTIAPDVSNKTVLTKITNSGKSFPTNITTNVSLTMPTTERNNLNGNEMKSVALSQISTSTTLNKPTEIEKTTMKPFPKITSKINLLNITSQTTKEKLEQTTEFLDSLKIVSSEKSLNSQKSTISSPTGSKEEHNSNTIISTQSFTEKKTVESTMKSQKSLYVTTTLPSASTLMTTTSTTIKPIMSIKKKTSKIENSIEVSNPSTMRNKRQTKKTTEDINIKTTTERIQTSKIINITHYNKISEKIKSRKIKDKSFSTEISKNQGYKNSITSHILNSQYSINTANIETTTEPNTMGAGPLVIVVLLPFLALFLIAVVTALRRKMKKSNRRIVRVQSRDLDNTSDRNQSQMIPLTKTETNE